MRWITVLIATLALAAGACGDTGAEIAADGAADDAAADTATEASVPGELVGLFRIEPGECGDGGVETGSWFRMVQSGGDLEDGPFVPNGDSPCDDPTWLPLEPGDDGGLLTGEFQEHPDPAFNDDGDALAARLAAPATWFAVDFALATNPIDPQTGTEVDAPRVEHDGAGGLAGDLRAFAAAWNGQHFNQGAPKPDGETPGHTQPVTGTFDPATGAYTLTWASHIVGGPFDGFTGVWHLEGTFDGAG